MPTFETLEPIHVALDLGAADVRLVASDRNDTIVTVRPGPRADEAALRAVEQVRVDHEDGALRISSPKARAFSFHRRSRSIEITVELPAGSALSGEVQTGDVHAAGRLGACRLKASDGAIHLERTGPAHLVASDGDITVGSIGGDAEIATDDGDIRLGDVEGTAVVRNSDGTTTIGTVTGRVRVRADDGDVRIGRAGGDVDVRTSDGDLTIGDAGGDVQVSADDGDVRIGQVEGAVVVKTSDGTTTISAAAGEVRVRADDGDIRIGRAGAGVNAKTSDGDISVGEVTQGSVVLGSDDGDIEVGIAAGTAAWLDLDTESGHVRSDLESTTSPGEAERTVQVRGRTSSGDITVRRAPSTVRL